jgi:hypothetical protein
VAQFFIDKGIVEIFFSVTANQINLGSFFLPAGLVGGYIKTGSLFY